VIGTGAARGDGVMNVRIFAVEVGVDAKAAGGAPRAELPVVGFQASELPDAGVLALKGFRAPFSCLHLWQGFAVNECHLNGRKRSRRGKE